MGGDGTHSERWKRVVVHEGRAIRRFFGAPRTRHGGDLGAPRRWSGSETDPAPDGKARRKQGRPTFGGGLGGAAGASLEAAVLLAAGMTTAAFSSPDDTAPL